MGKSGYVCDVYGFILCRQQGELQLLSLASQENMGKSRWIPPCKESSAASVKQGFISEDSKKKKKETSKVERYTVLHFKLCNNLIMIVVINK